MLDIDGWSFKRAMPVWTGPDGSAQNAPGLVLDESAQSAPGPVFDRSRALPHSPGFHPGYTRPDFVAARPPTLGGLCIRIIELYSTGSIM